MRSAPALSDRFIRRCVRWAQRFLFVCACGIGAAHAAALDALYAERCAQCHASGAGGAPIPGDGADWAKRVSAGLTLVYRAALEGMPNTAMAAKGGHRDLTGAQVRALVDHMLAQTRLEASVLAAAARYEALGIASASFIRLDANRDGSLSRDEVREDPELLARFAKFDRDADGRLSEAEFVAAEAMLAAERAAVRVDDEVLRARVRETLAGVNGISMTGIKIDVADGAVTVAGVVPTGEIARRAETALKRIAGLRRLDYRLMSGEMLHFD